MALINVRKRQKDNHLVICIVIYVLTGNTITCWLKLGKYKTSWLSEHGGICILNCKVKHSKGAKF